MKITYFNLGLHLNTAIKAGLQFALLFLSVLSFAEGTAQLTPTLPSDNQGVLQFWDNTDINRNSATFGCQSEKRLNFTIVNPNEQVYFGMSFEVADITGGNTLWYRIISPSSAVVFPTSGIGWQQVTNAGAGYIASWAQAIAGPNSIVGGTGGYTPLSFMPLESGDFYIEYYKKSNTGMPTAGNTPVTGITTAQIGAQQRTKTRLRYFDLTITDVPAGSRINGRLFSKTWDINVNAANDPFIAKMYVYSDDGVVTSIDFNRIRPFGFAISCNATGVANTGSTASDRKSVANNFAYAQYKIFLNNPDITAYPTGAFGDVLNKSNITISGCNVNNLCINVDVDKAGAAQLLLNFNGVPGYQGGTSDLLIPFTLAIGSNCIPWNGRDGLGNLVAIGSAVDMRLDYLNGITHIPLFDVENHPYGFIVNIVRPAGPQPLMFWDDTNLPGGTVNLAGATTGPTTGVHGFGSVTSGQMPASSNPTTTDWGNNRTINTWWYANYFNLSATYNGPTTILVDANATIAGTGATNDITICTNNGPISLAAAVANATGLIWFVKSSLTGTFANATSPNTTYTPSAADLTLPSFYIYARSTGNGACPAVADSMKVTLIPKTTVNAGVDQTICAGVVTLTGSAANATNFMWSGVNGIFSNQTSLNTTYTPSAAEIAAQTFTLSLSATSTAPCPSVTDEIYISIIPGPTVNAGPNQTICAENSVTLFGTATNATTFLWSGGAGTFSNPTSLTTSYTPSVSETTVSLTLTASKAGCNTVSSNVVVTINPIPTISYSPSLVEICSGSNTAITLSSSVSNTIFSWTATSSDAFTSGFSNNFGSTISQSLVRTKESSGTVSYVVSATSSLGCVSTITTIPVSVNKPIIRPTILPRGKINNTYTQPVPFTTNGLSNATYTLSPTSTPLPAGMRISGNKFNDVLYRANNQKATGAYTPSATVDLRNLDELSRDRESKRLALGWIKDNPTRFVQLSMGKVLLFLGDDSYGAYASLRKGRVETPHYVYLIAKLACVTPWFLTWFFMLAWLLRFPINPARGDVRIAWIVATPILYLLAIHAVFESGSKYHFPVLTLVLCLASFVLRSADFYPDPVKTNLRVPL